MKTMDILRSSCAKAKGSTVPPSLLRRVNRSLECNDLIPHCVMDKRRKMNYDSCTTMHFVRCHGNTNTDGDFYPSEHLL